MLRRFLQQLVVIVYCLMTVSALFFTMTKTAFPLPHPVIRWNYGMMAPYQGDTTWNADFIYEGRRADGTWEVINTDPYLPHGFGEKNVRKFMRVFAYLGGLGHRVKFGEYALLLMDRERARGRDYRAIRVWFDQWDRSPAGYEYLHTPLFTTRELVTQVQAPDEQP